MACMEPEFFSIVKSETGEEVDSGIIHEYDWSTGNDSGIVTEGATEEVHMDIEPPLSLEVYEEVSFEDGSYEDEHDESTVDDPSEEAPLQSSLDVPNLSHSASVSQDALFGKVYRGDQSKCGSNDEGNSNEDLVPDETSMQKQQVPIQVEPGNVAEFQNGVAKETIPIKVEPDVEKTQNGDISMETPESYRWNFTPLKSNTEHAQGGSDSTVVPLIQSSNEEPSSVQLTNIYGSQMTLVKEFQLNSGPTVQQYMINQFLFGSALPLQQLVEPVQNISTSRIDDKISKRSRGLSWHSKYSCGGCKFCDKFKRKLRREKCIVGKPKGNKKGSRKKGTPQHDKGHNTDKEISSNASSVKVVKKPIHMKTPQKLNSNRDKLLELTELKPKNMTELIKQLTSFSYWNANLKNKAPLVNNLALPSNILGQVCKECQKKIKSAFHYSSFVNKCQKCKYITHCVHAILSHSRKKKAPVSLDSIGTKCHLECACGLITESGSEMANHLCHDECEYDQKSCRIYDTVQSSTENDTDCIVIDDNDGEAISVLDTFFVDVESVEDSDDCIIIDEIPSQQKSPESYKDQHCSPLCSSTNKSTLALDSSKSYIHEDEGTNSLLSGKPHEDVNLNSLNSSSFINILDAPSRIRNVVTTNINPCTNKQAISLPQTESESVPNVSISKEKVHSNFYGENLEKLNRNLRLLEAVYKDHNYIFHNMSELLEDKLMLDLKKVSSFMSSEKKLRRTLSYSSGNKNKSNVNSTDNKQSDSKKQEKDKLIVIPTKRTKRKTLDAENLGEVTYSDGQHVVYKNCPNSSEGQNVQVKNDQKLPTLYDGPPILQPAFDDAAPSLLSTSHDGPPSLQPALNDDPLSLRLTFFDNLPPLRSVFNDIIDHVDNHKSEKHMHVCQRKKNDKSENPICQRKKNDKSEKPICQRKKNDKSEKRICQQKKNVSEHNILERNRRANLAYLYQALREQVMQCDTSVQSEKIPKITVLRRAAMVIAELKWSSNQLEQEKKDLYDQNHRLRHMLQLLK